MPRASHFFSHEHSLGERSTPMCTSVVNRIERSVDVEKRYFLTPSFHCPRLTWSDLAGFGDFHELGHSAPPGAQHTPAGRVPRAARIVPSSVIAAAGSLGAGALIR